MGGLPLGVFYRDDLLFAANPTHPRTAKEAEAASKALETMGRAAEGKFRRAAGG